MQNDTFEKTKSWALISGILGVIWGLFVGLSPIVMDQKTLWGTIFLLVYPLAVVKDGFQGGVALSTTNSVNSYSNDMGNIFDFVDEFHLLS